MLFVSRSRVFQNIFNSVKRVFIPSSERGRKARSRIDRSGVGPSWHGLVTSCPSYEVSSHSFFLHILLRSQVFESLLTASNSAIYSHFKISPHDKMLRRIFDTKDGMKTGYRSDLSSFLAASSICVRQVDCLPGVVLIDRPINSLSNART